MKTIGTWPFILAFGGSVLLAQEKNARAIVEKGINAQGGTTNIAKLRTMRVKAEGTAILVAGQPEVPFTIEDIWQIPDRYKTSATFQMGDQKFAQTQAIVGDKGWIQVNGQTQEMPKDAVAEMKEQKYAEDLDRLGFLTDAGVELLVIDPGEVEGKPVNGVLVRSKAHREVRLYFDTVSGFLLKRAHRLIDSTSGKEVLQEVIFSDYQNKNGLKYYTKIAAFRDGKKLLDAKVIEVEFFDKLDDKVFAKP